MKEFADYIKQLILDGWPPLAIIAIGVILFLLFFPEKAEKIGLILKTPLFRAFKWFARSYISSTIGSSVTDFINKELFEKFDNAHKSKIKVKLNLITDKEQINLSKKSLIIRLNESNDQTRNKIVAASLAIPKIVCPYIRSNLNPEINKAIDLTVLRKFAERLGNNGSLLYKLDFLDPEILENPNINVLLDKLIKIDTAGFFVSIFANELNYLGAGAYAKADITNKSSDVIGFLDYLLRIAERNDGEVSELKFQSPSINVNVILLAIRDKAENFGPEPYLRRLRTAFREGADSIYIVAFSQSVGFLSDCLKALSLDQRFSIINTYQIGSKRNKSNTSKISLVRQNESYLDGNLSEHLIELNIETGSTISGLVSNVSKQSAIVSFAGINAFIRKDECDWYAVDECSTFLKEGHEYDFLIKDIRYATDSIELTRRFPNSDPWIDARLPAVGDIVRARIVNDMGQFLTALTASNVEIRIPQSEVVWGDLSHDDINELFGKDVEMLITKIQADRRLIGASLKMLPAKNWAEVKLRFPEGAEILGTVVEKNSQYVTIELAKGFNGRVTKESFFAAGFEFRDYEKNLALGSKLEVVVQKVWIGREKISLELKRNVVNRALPAANVAEPIEHKIVKMKSVIPR